MKTIAVIGMGPSGLAAAKKLLELGFKVILIEAKPHHVGGRVFTQLQHLQTGQVIDLIGNESLVNNPDYTLVENGAGWIHYTGTHPVTGRANPVKQIADAAGIKTVAQNSIAPVTYDFNNRPFSNFYNLLSGMRYLSSGAASALECQVYRDAVKGKDRASYADVIQDLIVEKKPLDLQKCSEADLMSSRLFAHKMMQFYLAGTPTQQASAIPTQETFDGVDHFMMGGYSRVMQILFQSIKSHPRLTIMQGHEVIKIKNYQTGTTLVETNQTEINCDAVISTIPAGVLQNNSNLFSPDLPQQKIDLIKKIHVGNMIKVYCHFKSAFWPEQAQYLIPLAAYKKLGADKNWFSIVAAPPKNENTHTLMICFYGEDALTHETAYSKAIAELKNLFGAAFQNPISHHVNHAWKNDRFAAGAWCALDESMTAQDIDRLGAPVGNLFFAGDLKATDTVHLSMISGEKAAQEVFVRHALLCDQQSLPYIQYKLHDMNQTFMQLHKLDSYRKQIKLDALNLIKNWVPANDSQSIRDLIQLRMTLTNNEIPFTLETESFSLFNRQTLAERLILMLNDKLEKLKLDLSNQQPVAPAPIASPNQQ